MKPARFYRVLPMHGRNYKKGPDVKHTIPMSEKDSKIADRLSAAWERRKMREWEEQGRLREDGSLRFSWDKRPHRRAIRCAKCGARKSASQMSKAGKSCKSCESLRVRKYYVSRRPG